MKALGRLGFRPFRQVGSHLTMRRNQTQVTVPMHASIDAGTLAKILKRASVDGDEFLKNL